MRNQPESSHRSSCARHALAGLILCGLASCDSSPPPPKKTPTESSSTTLATIASPEDEALLRKLCTQCHLFSEPSLLPKADWGGVIRRMAQMPNYGRTIPKRIASPAIIEWFEQRAPEKLTVADRGNRPIESPFGMPLSVPADRAKNAPFLAQVRLANWPPTGEPTLLACDMRNGRILRADVQHEPLQLKTFCDEVPHPARVEVVDLDGDGATEFLVANLGSFVVMDHNLGSVDWLRPTDTGWNRIVLAENLGRVADVKAFDADADGDLDIAVAEFGWNLTGHVLLLENTTPRSQRGRTPQFTPRTLDQRHGAEQIEIVDLNSDDRPDVITLLGQEHEMVVAYLNQGGGNFQTVELFRAPHPVWGSSGFQLVDLDGDHDWDVLVTNGDMMDDASFKPYHGVFWLENMGDLKFASHTLAEVPGAHRAEAADLDGDGDLDIAVCALAPNGAVDQAGLQGVAVPPSLVWLEQSAPGEFRFHVWEAGPGRYPTMAIGDLDGDGRLDLALGVGLWDWPDGKSQNQEVLRLWTRK